MAEAAIFISSEKNFKFGFILDSLKSIKRDRNGLYRLAQPLRLRIRPNHIRTQFKSSGLEKITSLNPDLMARVKKLAKSRAGKSTLSLVGQLGI